MSPAHTCLEDAAAIEQSVAQAAALRPAYATILGFYGPVFTAQAKSAAHTHPPIIAVDESLVEMKRREGFSLIDPSAFTVDNEAAGTLLTEICGIARVSEGKLAGVGHTLAAAMADGVTVERFLVDVLDNGSHIRAFADEMDVAPDLLSLLFYLAIRPSVEIGARRLASHLAEDEGNRNSCPICGSAPIIGELDADGRLWVHCSLCWHRWTVERMVCLSCGNRSGESLEYLYSEEEPEYRVYLCNECQQYLKVVDTRKLDRIFFPPLEQVVSLHLDIKAAEKGYAHAMGAGTALF
jgi:FdhE protein